MEVFDLEGFAVYLTHCAEKGKQSHLGLELCAQIVEQTAKAEIGEYQPEAYPFPAWAPLAESTLEQKEKLGYSPPDNPLWRTGALRDSISHEVENDIATIGSDSEVMVYHEFGTSKMPMRPVLGPALMNNLKNIDAILGHAATGGFIRETLTKTLPDGTIATLSRMVEAHSTLGYDWSF
jgi:phage gpG-like protein